jgi:hypothetical protein
MTIIARARVLAASCGLLIAVTLGAECLSASVGAEATTAPPSARVPLDDSLATTGATWVEVAMGDLAQRAETFWQLLVLGAGSPQWSLVTPPGVADNGGLVSAGSGSSLVSGFEASQLIRFSPVELTADEGKIWTQGVLSDQLADSPDALAESASGTIAALTGNPATSVVASDSALSSWRRVVSFRALAASPAGRSCALASITAVAFSPAGQLLLGGSCSRPGKVGVFEESASGWRLAGPSLPARSKGSSTSVLRLRAWDGGVSAVVAARSGEHTSLLGTLYTAGAGWSAPAALELARSESIAASGVSADGALGVLLSGDAGPVIDLLGPGSGSWAELPEPPARTSALGLEPGGVTDAMAVVGSKLTVYRLDAEGTGWQRTQVMKVPIQYGSSS